MNQNLHAAVLSSFRNHRQKADHFHRAKVQYKWSYRLRDERIYKISGEEQDD